MKSRGFLLSRALNTIALRPNIKAALNQRMAGMATLYFENRSQSMPAAGSLWLKDADMLCNLTAYRVLRQRSDQSMSVPKQTRFLHLLRPWRQACDLWWQPDQQLCMQANPARQTELVHDLPDYVDRMAKQVPAEGRHSWEAAAARLLLAACEAVAPAAETLWSRP